VKIKGTRILVTGGAGFIGSHIVDSLVRQGAQVTIYDNFSSGLMENLQGVRKDVKIIRGDILDRAKLSRAIKGAELVSHQAAQLEITRCIDDPVEDLQMNTVGTLNVLHACVAHGVRKLISASSACVYGQAERIPESEDKHPTNPNWAYGVSKLAGEKYCAIYSELYKMPTVCLRYGIVYGPREWYGRVLTIFLRRALSGKPPVVFGKGDQLRDFTFVGDVVRLHDLCIQRETGPHQVLNASTGKATSIEQLARQVVSVTGIKSRPLHESVAPGERSELVEENRLRLPSELQAMVLSPAKGRALLGWKPEVALKAGLKIEWEWISANPGRWKSMSY